MTGTTRELAEWVSATCFDELPDDVLARTRTHLLDTLAAVVVGHSRPWTRRVLAYAEEQSPPGNSMVLPAGPRLRPEWAALVNGTAAHGFEIDDYALPGLSHPGCAVVPAALAVAQDLHAVGRRLLTALAIGYEITVRFGRATTPSLTSDRGFHVTSVLGVLGATAAAASLSGLDAATTQSALGLAASMAGGTTEFTRTGGDVKRLHGGFAAAAGCERPRSPARDSPGRGRPSRESAVFWPASSSTQLPRSSPAGWGANGCCTISASNAGACAPGCRHHLPCWAS
ncbi:MmgE/PrpD family protein [Prauserella oleivorans]